jgi:tetratricopeptide (TPR) repeat protein
MNKYILWGIGAMVVVGVVFVLVEINPGNKNDSSGIVKVKEVNISPQDREIYEQRLEQAKFAVKGLNKDTQDVDKYSAYFNLSSAYFSLGFYQKSKEAQLKALEIRPKDFDGWRIYSSILTAMEDYQGALEAVDKTISIRPDIAEFWRWKVLLEQERFDATKERQEEIYEEALKKTKNNIDIIIPYARFSEEVGEIIRAIELFQLAQTIRPDLAEGYEFEIERLKAL